MGGPPAPTLEFEEVTIEAHGLYDSAVWEVDFRLLPSELVLLRLERGHCRLPLADGAEGLIEPSRGRIRFLGEDWAEMLPRRIAAQRGRIGRIFEEASWIENLDVDQNITLSQRHHTRRNEMEIIEEASSLARRFDLPGLPRGPVWNIRRQDLHRSACVRAFLGSPALVILERPTRELYPEVMPGLINTVQELRGRGGAVLWTTDNVDVWSNPAIHPTQRYQMFGARMRVLEEGP